MTQSNQIIWRVYKQMIWNETETLSKLVLDAT
jgi:hypothetical protein